MATLEYRHPAIDDIDSLTDILNRSDRENPFHTDNTVEEVLAFSFKEEDYDPRGFLLAILDGETVAYGGSHVEKHRIDAGMNDAWISIAVIPEFRNRGIEQHLMEFSLDYLRSRSIGTAKRWAHGLEGWKHDLAREYGFRDVRHTYMMRWQRQNAPEAIPPPRDIKLEHVMFKEASDELIGRFTDNFNTSFADHYDFSSVQVKDLIKWRDISRNFSRITFAKKDDEIAGVCLYDVSTVFNEENNTRIGWADILGVNPEYRKMGIGRTLLSTAMQWIWEQGMDTIYLGMDAENSRALGLYTSLGYEIHQESINYSLEL